MTQEYFLGVIPYTKYAFYWEVTDNTVGRVAPSEVRYGDILSAVLDAEKHIREDLSPEEQGHILIIKVFDKSPDERRAGTFTPVYIETFGQEPSDTVFLAGDPRRLPHTLDGYWFAVFDHTDNERFAGSQRYTSTSVAVATARGYITDRIDATGYLQGHDLDIEVYLAAPVEGLVSGGVFHTEKYIHLETTPLRKVLGIGVQSEPASRWIDIAERIKTKVPGLTNEVNEHLNNIIFENSDADASKWWLVDKGRDLGIR